MLPKNYDLERLSTSVCRDVTRRAFFPRKSARERAEREEDPVSTTFFVKNINFLAKNRSKVLPRTSTPEARIYDCSLFYHENRL